ncbi:N-acetylglucosamine-6-phosphate deacetylase [Roseitranquillus sediminis]|uniref:N-acetylglucosamine-6-phosphate deacetylase n=1 Tax=Roseitranquillus sediminis TaxID=2809051 RepID=UPI001D0BFD4F|nr:amidohydrolase family protein [Roseitranquillus sediminis]MBM9595445.1 amidohydrolase family protein [Roseitranquillus sediminis]
MTGHLFGCDPATGRGLAVDVADGVIVAVNETAEAPKNYLSAGLVDLQVNGHSGIDLAGDKLSADDVARLTRLLWSRGTTTYLPTLITAAEPTLIRALKAIAAAREQDALVAHTILGVHVEGPAISPDDGPRGAHPRAHVRPPDLDEVARWQEASGGLVSMITMSPHWDGAAEFVRGVTDQGIVVALGHTHATPEQIRAAVDAGATFSTHLGNGAAAMLPRHPNMIWTQLAEDRLSASFIADGHHLPADVLTAMIRAKGLARSILVSDSAALAGMPPGLYEQPIGGRVELRADGWLGTSGTVYLAGASRSLDEDVAIAADLAGLTLAQALSLATVNPGRYVGHRGCLAVGASADLILFDWSSGARTLKIRETWVKGQRQ